MGELPLVQEDESHRVSAVCVVRRLRQTPGTCMTMTMQIVPGCCKKIGIGPKWNRLIFFFFSLTWVSGPACAHLD